MYENYHFRTLNFQGIFTVSVIIPSDMFDLFYIIKINFFILILFFYQGHDRIDQNIRESTGLSIFTSPG